MNQSDIFKLHTSYCLQQRALCVFIFDNKYLISTTSLPQHNVAYFVVQWRALPLQELSIPFRIFPPTLFVSEHPLLPKALLYSFLKLSHCPGDCLICTLFVSGSSFCICGTLFVSGSSFCKCGTLSVSESSRLDQEPEKLDWYSSQAMEMSFCFC